MPPEDSLEEIQCLERIWKRAFSVLLQHSAGASTGTVGFMSELLPKKKQKQVEPGAKTGWICAKAHC